jgi:hypothetical protein
VFVHRSLSLVAFRHRIDERNPADVTWRSTPPRTQVVNHDRPGREFATRCRAEQAEKAGLTDLR